MPIWLPSKTRWRRHRELQTCQTLGAWHTHYNLLWKMHWNHKKKSREHHCAWPTHYRTLQTLALAYNLAYTVAYNRLTTFQKVHQLPEHQLIQDEPTWWNSTYYILVHLKEQRPALTSYGGEDDIPLPTVHCTSVGTHWKDDHGSSAHRRLDSGN